MSDVRRAVVLGAGGLLGVAWTLGALHALAQVDGVDPREADVLLGTSAGAVTAAFLGAGLGIDAMLRHQRGLVVPGDPRIDYDYDTGTGCALPTTPLPWPGSASLLRRAVRHPHSVRRWLVRRAGTQVRLLTPGAEDLAAMGGNLMDPHRRAHVLETSLRMSAAALA